VRALLYHGPGDLRVEEVPRPEPGPGDVLVQVEVALTDGTDAKAFRRGHPLLLAELPSPFGHEFCGIDVHTGRRVVAANSAPCGSCAPCKRNEETLCENLQPFLSGAYAEYLLVPARIAERNLLPVPPELAPEVAAMVEPLACCLNGVERAEVKPGSVRAPGRSAMAGGVSRISKTRSTDEVDTVGLPAPTEGEPIPAGQSVWISRPDNSIRDVWTSGTEHHFVFRDPGQRTRFEEIVRERDELFGALPDRNGNASIAHRLNQLSRWFPRPIIWIVVGVVALLWRKPRGATTLTALGLAALLVIVLNALGLFADPRFALPVAPAFVLFGLGALVGRRP